MTLQKNQYSSSKFSPTKANTPCPICDDIKGKCRIVGEDFVLCMTHPTDADLVGWKYLGETTGSYFAGKYVRTSQESEAEREQRRANNLKLRIAQQKAQRERLTKLPDAAQRDRLYQGYLQKLSLNDLDKSDLQSRGLTEYEILQLGVKSVKAGYILPIRNLIGQIVGTQIRLRDASSGRYRWHKPFGLAAQQQNGELPLAFYGDIQGIPQRIILVEGTGIKPYIASKVRLCPAIGASGGQFVSSQLTLLSYLQNIKASPEHTKFEYAIDAGDVSNPSVMHRHEKNLDFFTELGYAIDILWWGQISKTDDDIDELSDGTSIELLQVEQFLKLANYQRKPKFVPFQWLRDKLFPKLDTKGFSKRSPQVTTHIIEYQSGQRLETWHNLLQTHKHVLDVSATGTGKSHDSGLLRTDIFNGDIDKIIYISNDSRNVTTETLQDWQILPARHQGLTSKNGKLRRAKHDDELHRSANCARTGAIAALRNKAISDTSIVCETCPVLNACRHASGDGYGFRHERAIAFKSNILRSHPASLPSPDEYDYSKTLLVWEEVNESLSTMHQILVDRADVDAAIAKLSRANIDGLAEFIPILHQLYDLLGNKSRFGLDFHAIEQAITIPETIDISLLDHIFQPDLSIFDTVDGIADSEFENAKGQEKRDLARIHSLLKRETTLHAVEVEKKIDREILKQWFSEFVDILLGNIQHSDLHIQNGKLMVSLLDPRLRQISYRAASNLYLDATINFADLELRLGTSVHVVKQSGTLSMPTIYQVNDIGRLGMQRGNEQTRQAEAIASHLRNVDPTTKVIDFKKFDTDGAWFRDSRGSNDFKDVNTFVVTGTPCQNIAALKAEFAVLTGLHPSDQDQSFADFVDRHILANVQQCFGRKLGKRFQEGNVIYFLSNFNLGDIPHIQIKASEITPKAMSKQAIFRSEISQRFNDALAEGFDLISMSQREIAEWLGISWGKFRHHFEWIDSLLRFLYSNPIQNLDENAELTFNQSEMNQIEFWAGATEHLLADSVPMQLIFAAVLEFFDQRIPQYLHRFVVSRLSASAINRLFSSLAVLAISKSS